MDSSTETPFEKRYKILQTLGTGGIARVVKAQDADLQVEVAIKRLLRKQLEPKDILRFQNEARTSAKLNHRNIVRIHDFGMIDEVEPYLVMEYLPGRSLRQLLEEEELEEADIVDICCQICDGIQHAHSRGVIHLDLTPRNVIVGKDDDDNWLVKVIDFGTSFLKRKSTEGFTIEVSGAVAGTPAYMSPEQCKGNKCSEGSDVYSMGCILFEMVSGRQPYAAESVAELCAKHVEEPVPALYRNGERSYLESVVRKAMSKNTADRYTSMLELRSAILDAAPVEEESAGPAPSSAVETKSRLPIVLSSCLVVSLIGIASFYVTSTFSGPSTHTDTRTDQAEPSVRELIREAIAARDSGQSATAITLLDKAIHKDGNSAEAYYERGLINQKVKYLGRALSDFESARRLNPKAYEPIGRIADVHRQRNRPDLAIKYLNPFIEQIPRESKLIFCRALAFADLGQLKPALQDLDRAIELDPGKARYLIYRAEMKRRLGKSDDALKDIRKALSMGFISAESQSIHARILQNLGRLDEARTVIDNILKVEGLNPDYHILSGANWAAKGRDDLAEKAYKHCVKLDSSCTAAYINLERLYKRNKKDGLSALYLGLAYKSNPDDSDVRERIEPFLKKGELAFNPDRVERLIAADSRELEKSKHQEISHIHRAVHYFRIGRYEKAQKDCLGFMQHSMKHSQDHLLMAQLCAILARRTGDKRLVNKLVYQYISDPGVGEIDKLLFRCIGNQISSEKALIMLSESEPEISKRRIRAQCIVGLNLASSGNENLSNAIELLILPAFCQVDIRSNKLAQPELYRLLRYKESHQKRSPN